jgi:hypothetical protein
MNVGILINIRLFVGPTISRRLWTHIIVVTNTSFDETPRATPTSTFLSYIEETAVRPS